MHFLFQNYKGMLVKNLAAPEDAKVIDATGKLVIPGGIDTHTHFELAFYGNKKC